MHPATDNVSFQFQVNADGQTGFNEPMTTTIIEAYHAEDDGSTTLRYNVTEDQATTGANNGLYQTILGREVGTDDDQSVSGILTLYDPSSTTYVKHFTSVGNVMHYADFTLNQFDAGYINTTAAIDEISFKMSSGNIDDGTIKMFGVS
tara:strand:+ start:85 stop:528 length:444 start_codon:yes stop_codon:yes gene_type:complete